MRELLFYASAAACGGALGAGMVGYFTRPYEQQPQMLIASVIAAIGIAYLFK